MQNFDPSPTTGDQDKNTFKFTLTGNVLKLFNFPGLMLLIRTLIKRISEIIIK